ncbi:uncharacterized protein PAC_16755 [Phialocephala subalpina]|uniref:Phytanoyl-CoA dioxygenase family protein n=1 Tax=Phialocephala subalpina TaxID=576137 RepID=A0A1L7XPA5_9HELO|nr:uncharacterized protein PAC_16755 [Phialocephala subalpina]
MSLRYLRPTTIHNRVTLGQGTTFLPGKRDPSITHHISHILEHGYAILPRIFTFTQVSRALSELARLESQLSSGPAAQGGRNPFKGFKTRRVYALPDKSRAFDCFPIHDTVLKILDHFLEENYLVTSYHTVTIEPGEREQEMHTDDGLIDLPRPRPLMGIVCWRPSPKVLSAAKWTCADDTGIMSRARWSPSMTSPPPTAQQL